MMQRKRINSTKAPKRLIRPADYARRRGLNRSTISRQIALGKIPTHDGLVNPREADQARADNLDMWRGRRKEPKARAAASVSDFDLGRTWLAQRLAENFRTAWPAFIAEEPGLTPKALLVALLGYVVESWLQDFLDSDRLPAINWKVFGEDAEAVRADVEALRSEWTSTAGTTGTKGTR